MTSIFLLYLYYDQFLFLFFERNNNTNNLLCISKNVKIRYRAIRTYKYLCFGNMRLIYSRMNWISMKRCKISIYKNIEFPVCSPSFARVGEQSEISSLIPGTKWREIIEIPLILSRYAKIDRERGALTVIFFSGGQRDPLSVKPRGWRTANLELCL